MGPPTAGRRLTTGGPCPLCELQVTDRRGDRQAAARRAADTLGPAADEHQLRAAREDAMPCPECGSERVEGSYGISVGVRCSARRIWMIEQAAVAAGCALDCWQRLNSCDRKFQSPSTKLVSAVGKPSKSASAR
jgi:hypothetical protein